MKSLFIPLLFLSIFGFSQAKVDSLITKNAKWAAHYNKDSIDNLVLTLFKKTSTGGLTLPSTATDGILQYNTVDQTTNYERLRHYWNSNTYTITTEAGGSGLGRSILINGVTLTLQGNSTPLIIGSATLSGMYNFNRGFNFSNTSVVGITGTFTQSSGYANSFVILNQANQTSTGGYRGIWISPYLQAVGSTGTLLLDIGTNTAAAGAGTHTPVFTLNNLGDIVTGSTSTGGHLFYNTSDQITNYERLRMYWSSNVYTITTENGGSGVNRSIRFIGNSRSYTVGGSNAFFEFGAGSTGTTTPSAAVSGTRSNSSGAASDFLIGTTINQTSTASYKGLWISPLLTAVGSGGGLLIDAGTNTSALAAGTHTSKFGVNTNGKILLYATNTAGGTTGNQTINRPSGTVNIAASGTSVTVTNSEVTTSSIIYAVIRTADATAWIKSVVPSSGSFVITLGAAATAETSIGFIVYN
ncbi:MAG: hypothetical protein QM802_19820 [Agriterribacter sp.]